MQLRCAWLLMMRETWPCVLAQSWIGGRECSETVSGFGWAYSTELGNSASASVTTLRRLGVVNGYASSFSVRWRHFHS